MAAHLAGIKTAVATCGTAFGAGHIKVVRRMITDDGSGGELSLPSMATPRGRKTALAAFEEDQRSWHKHTWRSPKKVWTRATFACTGAMRRYGSLIASRRPLFEFVIDTTLKRFDLTTLEGRVLAMRAIAPIIAGIRDRDLRPAYMRKASGQLGMELEEIQRAVAYAQRNPSGRRSNYNQRRNDSPYQNGEMQARHQPGPTGAAHAQQPAQNAPTTEPQQEAPQPEFFTPNPADPIARLERTCLEIALQHPNLMSVPQWQEFARVSFRYRTHQEIARGIIHAASQIAPAPGVAWLNYVRAGSAEEVHHSIAELSVAQLPVATAEKLPYYIEGVLNSLFEHQISRQKSDLMMRLEQLSSTPDSEEYGRIQRELLDLEVRRRTMTRH